MREAKHFGVMLRPFATSLFQRSCKGSSAKSGLKPMQNWSEARFIPSFQTVLDLTANEGGQLLHREIIGNPGAHPLQRKTSMPVFASGIDVEFRPTRNIQQTSPNPDIHWVNLSLDDSQVFFKLLSNSSKSQ